ncbi:MAG: 3-deoxy-7-phosphoheptulonate synthase [Burkholderiales bacterium]|nr:MAG: 3-deoxy-7-phosphoheptulonate synthase [Burkholderiales bacterium]
MTAQSLYNTHVESTEPLPTPAELKRAHPASKPALETVGAARRTIEAILDGTDPRLFVVCGPCSVHDPASALEYAERLRALAGEVADTLYLVMRVYFEKPRTTVGWKGLVNDPDMDDSFRLDKGLAIARELLIQINEMGLGCGTEALDPITPQYLGELIAWSAIGARTTESQTHREMASGLSTPVGFKNGTDGNLEVAINAMTSASHPHAFLGIDARGRVALIRTQGNPYGHLILRGGSTPNYDSVAVAQAQAALTKAGIEPRIVIDCSHGNSGKNHALQPLVLKDVMQQVAAGNRAIRGVMLESHLHAGNQKLRGDPKALRYGVSITDACIGWDTTQHALREAAESLHELVAHA